MTLWIMIAGPYSSGGADAAARASNLSALNEAAVEVFRRGHHPVIGVNNALPMIEAAGQAAFEEIMMPISLELAARCDAVLRIGGSSRGADAEVERFKARGAPVYRSLEELPEGGAS